MRVLYLTQYFPPELSGAAIRAGALVRVLRQQGHEVTVVTEFPNHPQGVLAPKHRGRLFERTAVAGGELLRVWVWTAPAKTFATRMAFYLSFMGTAVVAGTVATRGRFDVVYASSPPLFVGAAALALRVLRGVPLVFEVADLWPEAAVALGELRHPIAIRLAEWLERRCYRRAAHVVVTSHSARDSLVARELPASKVTVIMNGADTVRFTPQPQAAERLRGRLGLDRATVVLYAGLHGLANGLEVVIDAAERLRDRPPIRLLFVGEGPRRSALVAQARQRRLDNVIFHPGVPADAMPEFFSLAQMALVPLRKLGAFEKALPVKLFEAWACGCPTVVGVDGEAKALVHAADAGVWVEPDDPDALAAAIARLADEPALCRRLGANGRRYVEAHCSREIQGRQLGAILGAVSGDRSR